MEDHIKTVEFCYSAPAKFILSGEHSVVYGKDALVATIDMRTRVDSQVVFSQNAPEKSLPSYFAEVQLVQLKNNFQIVSFKLIPTKLRHSKESRT